MEEVITPKVGLEVVVLLSEEAVTTQEVVLVDIQEVVLVNMVLILVLGIQMVVMVVEVVAPIVAIKRREYAT
uniref:Uncharacterized protein n=1 Tax=Candidatus Kentrum sp. TUN TaxID=2126343 RepID=A0A451A8B6_9GAMM|nr:MAG: hypothetical protein BECKTUN1418E_GA0071001_101041 [Candidatus Kentron sp. TUN]VFK62265.1 MAG: hypothetical protein BECKTUN1418F_GA0071002_12971 [Candidatus Kentron sp. TUN]